MSSPLFAKAKAGAVQTQSPVGSGLSPRGFDTNSSPAVAPHRVQQISFARPPGPGTGQSVVQMNGDGKKRSNFMDAMHGLFGSKTGPLPQGPRSQLDSHLRQYDDPEPFTSSVDFVNKGLGVNTSAPLPQDKANKYMHDTTAVQQGTMSNSYAFGSSAWDWAKRGNYTAASMNFLGMMASGAHDHQKMKRFY